MIWDQIVIIAPIILSAIAAYAAGKAANAATKQSKIMREQLISAQRAWISFEVHADSALNFYATGAELGVVINVTNTGKTPALEVFTAVETTSDTQNLNKILIDFAKSS